MGTENFFRFERAVDSNNRRAERSGAIARLTLEEFEAAYIYFGGKCAYSGLPFDTNRMSIEHIIPIISGGHSMAFNCIPVNGKYNSSKSGYHLLDWWKCQTDAFGHSIYNPLRLLKVLNYMIKCLEAVNLDDPTVHILKDNEVDSYLDKHKEELNTNTENPSDRSDFRKISQIEVFRKMDMIRIEDLYSIYSELDSIKLNTAIFFEETIYELTGFIPEEILEAIENRIKTIPDIYIDGKKVLKKEMKPEDIRIRKQVLEWAGKEGLENKYGIIGYMDFEVLKKQPDIVSFLEQRKKIILEKMGAKPADFNNVVNKVPNILTNLGVENRISEISKHFKISSKIVDGKSSELYRYVVNKPDLLLASENMDILLKYVEALNIDKRLLKRGVPITTIIDNIEMAIDLVKRADLGVNEKTERRILDKLINGTTGSLLREAYRMFRRKVREKQKGISYSKEKRDAARWIICISEKYNASEILKSRRITQTKGLYRNMSFDGEGFLNGVNPNAYIVPKIISLAALDISREAESELINNVFFVDQIRQGIRADTIIRDLGASIKKDDPNISNEELMKKAARWFIFLSETSEVPLSVMFDDEVKDKYIEVTKEYYESMRFDEKGNFINQEIPELHKWVIGIDYMQIADSFFKSTESFYIIKGKYIAKAEIQKKLYAELSKCKNKKAVKSACIKMLRELSRNIDRGGGNIGE